MDSLYFLLAIPISAALTSSAPLGDGYVVLRQNRPGQELAGHQNVGTKILLPAEDNLHHLAKRDVDDDDSDDDDDEMMGSAADTYVYVPYVRYRQYFGQRRRVYVNRRSDNALVGYADDRDRFPTVA